MNRSSLRVIAALILLCLFSENFAFANQSSPQGGPHDAAPSTAVRLPATPSTSSCPPLKTDRPNPRDPVLLTGGKLYIPITDVEIPGPGRQNGLNLKITRSYSSQDPFEGVFGKGWVSNLDVSTYLSVTLRQVAGQPPVAQAGAIISFRDEDGSLLSFILAQDTTLNGTPIRFTDGQRSILWTPDATEPLKNGRFRYVKPHGTAYNMQLTNSIFRMMSMEDRNGNKIYYRYDAKGRIDQLSDDAGQILTVAYSYSPFWEWGDYYNKVRRVQDGLGRQWHYYYTSDPWRSSYGGNELKSVADPLSRYVGYGFQQDQSYIPYSPLISVTDYMNFKTTYEYKYPDAVQTQTKPDGEKLRFSYDSLLGASTMIDEDGRTWGFEYFKIGLGTKVIDPDGGVWSYKYDPTTNLTTEFKDPLGHIKTYSYDANQNLTEVTDALGNRESFTYKSDYNQWLTHTDKEGRLTTREFDGEGNIIKTIDALGHVTTSTYNDKGWLLTTTDQNGNTTSFTYDAAGNTLSATDALGGTTSFTYDAVSRLTSTADANGKTTSFIYDAGDRLLSVTLPGGGAVSMTYDKNNRLLTRKDPNGNTTTLTYGTPLWGDDPGCGSCSGSDPSASRAHPTKIADALGRATQFTYDKRGNVKTVADANGNVTSFTYGIFDRLLTSTDANGGVTTLTYDKVGNLLKVKDANSHETTFEYDVLNRRISETDALGNRTSFDYDKEGNLIRRTDANGALTTYAYDALDRPTRTLYPDNTSVDLSFDPAGNLLSMTDPTGTSTYVYDADDRVTSVSMPGGKTLNYVFDPVGNVLSMTSPAGTTSYAYDALNRTTSVTAPGGAVTSYTYDAGGRRTQVLYSSNVKATYVYDAANELLSLTHTSLTNPSLQLPQSAYTYDAVGNRLTMQDNEGTHTYAYDKLYRLKQVTYPLGNAVAYTYDAVGNRLSTSDGVATENYAYDAANRLLSQGSLSFAYDANGNLISQQDTIPGKTMVYGYDFENRLTSAGPSQKPNKFAYVYDWVGRRTKRTVSGNVTKYYYEGFDVLFQTNAASTLTKNFTNGSRIDEVLSVNKRSYLYDGLGSVTALTKDSGQTSATYNYDVFGSVRSRSGTVTNDNLFTGRPFDNETGLYYYRNRYYSPSQGRFITKDPIGLRGGINLYAYVYNNPIGLIDPLGLSGDLAVHSYTDGTGSTSGHSWVEYKKDNGGTTTYGTYGNNNGAQRVKGLNINSELQYPNGSSRKIHINDNQEKAMFCKIKSFKNKGEKGWTMLNPCSSFACQVWKETTGESLRSRNWLGISNPTTLAASIDTANSND